MRPRRTSETVGPRSRPRDRRRRVLRLEVAEHSEPLHAAGLRNADLTERRTELRGHPRLLIRPGLPRFDDYDRPVASAANMTEQSLGPISRARRRIETEDLVHL